ncbi:MAG: PseG/SpsG family protein [Nitrospinaceae bacterium]
MPEAAIRCHASPAEGMGHVFRQLHVAKLLRDRGLALTFFIPEHSPSIGLLRREDFVPRIVEPHQGFPPGVTEKFDLVIVDLRDTTPEFIKGLRNHARRIASFEDLGEGRNHVDLLIDSNLEPAKGREVPSRVKPLFGLPYCVLAPVFDKAHRRTKSFSGKPRSVLVTMGGTDPNNLTLRLAKIFLDGDTDISFTFLAGPGFPHKPALMKLASATKSFRVVCSAPHTAELLFDHDAVFCSGGITLQEALAVGTPAFVISQVPHQAEKTKPMEEAGAAVYLGAAQNFRQENIHALLNIGGERLEAMSRVGKNLVDGRGIYRVADQLQSLMEA